MAVIEERETMLARGDALWEELRAGLEAHLWEPLGPGTDWTGHDVYAHFARWQERAIADLRQTLAGGRPADDGEDKDTLNERWRTLDRALPTDEVRARCVRSRQDLRTMLVAMPPEQWTAWGHRLAPDINGEHHEHHLAMLEAAR